MKQAQMTPTAIPPAAAAVRVETELEVLLVLADDKVMDEDFAFTKPVAPFCVA